MLSTVRRTAAALSLSLALVGTTAALAAPAQAERWTHDDAVGDVVRETMGDIDAGLTPAPERTNIDVTRVVANHQGRYLTIKVRTRAAMRGALMTNSLIRTPNKRFALWAMRMPMFGNSVELVDVGSKRKDPTVRCAGLKRTFDKSRTVMTTKIPRTCLGNPRWVRFNLVLSSMDLLSDDDFTYSDDALGEGRSSMFAPGKRSPKIKHG